MVVVATAGFAGVVAEEDAVIVTTPPAGILGGAVYVMFPTLAVCAGERLKVPQFPTLPQVAVQSMPRLLGSFTTLAEMLVCAPAVMDAGGAGDMVTTIGAAVITVATEEADLVASAVAVAVIVTVPFAGTPVGAVKVVAIPLAVWLGASSPQTVLPHCSVQSTPS